MRPRLVILLMVFFVALGYFFYHRNPGGWTQTVKDAYGAAQSVPGSNWSKAASEALAAFQPAPGTSLAADVDEPASAAPSSPADAANPNPAPDSAATNSAGMGVPATNRVAAPMVPGPAPNVPGFPVPVPSPAPTNWATFAATDSVNAATNSATPGATIPNLATTNAAPATSAALSPAQPWSPPDVMPAQDHWVWTTTDGQEYDDVVVNKIEPDTVSITHSRGVAHVAIATLTPEIQKRLNYDPVAAVAARKETDREAEHPYYRLTSLDEAKVAARELHWPLAWICGQLSELDKTDAAPGSESELTQMAVNDLKSQAVVIFLDGNDDLQKVAPVLLQQFYQYDDGPVPGGHHFFGPKIVFSDADVTKAYGRVSYTQMEATGDAAITNVLAAIASGTPAPAPTTNAPPVVP